MSVKYYTSSVPASISISRIEKLLVEIGAIHINKSYENNELRAISFVIIKNGRTYPFKLPARVNAIYKVLWSKVKRPKSDTKNRIKSQSERTAWRLVHEWVDMQITMIKLEQADFIELFLPHLYNYAKDQSYYETLVDTGLQKLLPRNHKTE